MKPPAAEPTPLSEAEQSKLARILSRLESPYEGERATAGLLATSFIAKHGLSWNDISQLAKAPAPSARADEAPRGAERRRSVGRVWRGYCRRRLVQIGQVLNRLS